jgi:WD40 repeat protein
VWDAATGQEFFTLQGHAGYVMSVAFSSDGNRIVTGSSDNTAKVWDTATGQELLTLKGHTGDAVRSVAFSPDGERIVTGSDDWTARLRDTATGQEVLALKGHTEAVYCVAFSPDGNRIVTGIAGARATAKVWDATTARDLLILTGHTDMVTRVAFSDDGQRIFAWDQQKKLLAWSVASGEPVDPVDPPPEPLPGPARSPDGFHHAVPQGNTVVVTDTSPLPDNAWPLRTRGLGPHLPDRR